MAELADIALTLHNNYRAQHGSPPLEWCEELQNAAQENARSLLFNPEVPLSPPKEGVFWGQNIFEYDAEGYGQVTDEEMIEEAIHFWYDDVTNYDQASPSPTKGANFSQMIWKSTAKVGVGLARKEEEGSTSIVVLAFYDPPGNFDEQFADNVSTENARSTRTKIIESRSTEANPESSTTTTEFSTRTVTSTIEQGEGPLPSDNSTSEEQNCVTTVETTTTVTNGEAEVNPQDGENDQNIVSNEVTTTTTIETTIQGDAVESEPIFTETVEGAEHNVDENSSIISTTTTTTVEGSAKEGQDIVAIISDMVKTATDGDMNNVTSITASVKGPMAEGEDLANALREALIKTGLTEFNITSSDAHQTEDPAEVIDTSGQVEPVILVAEELPQEEIPETKEEETVSDPVTQDSLQEPVQEPAGEQETAQEALAEEVKAEEPTEESPEEPVAPETPVESSEPVAIPAEPESVPEDEPKEIEIVTEEAPPSEVTVPETQPESEQEPPANDTNLAPPKENSAEPDLTPENKLEESSPESAPQSEESAEIVNDPPAVLDPQTEIPAEPSPSVPEIVAETPQIEETPEPTAIEPTPDPEFPVAPEPILEPEPVASKPEPVPDPVIPEPEPEPQPEVPETATTILKKDTLDLVVQLHNDHRRKHGAPSMKLDPKLCAETVAAAKSMVLNKNYDEENERTVVSQNVYRLNGPSEDHEETIKTAIGLWYSKVEEYKWNDPMTSLPACQPFCKLAWASSRKIGVAMETTGTRTILLVFYAPPANFEGGVKLYRANVRPDLF